MVVGERTGRVPLRAGGPARAGRGTGRGRRRGQCPQPPRPVVAGRLAGAQGAAHGAGRRRGRGGRRPRPRGDPLAGRRRGRDQPFLCLWALPPVPGRPLRVLPRLGHHGRAPLGRPRRVGCRRGGQPGGAPARAQLGGGGRLRAVRAHRLPHAAPGPARPGRDAARHRDRRGSGERRPGARPAHGGPGVRHLTGPGQAGPGRRTGCRGRLRLRRQAHHQSRRRRGGWSSAGGRPGARSSSACPSCSSASTRSSVRRWAPSPSSRT